MKLIKKLVFIGALGCAMVLARPGLADEFDRETSRQVFEKTYEWYDFRDRAYEIGVANLTVTADCGANETDAESVLNQKIEAIRALVINKYSELKLETDTPLSGFELDLNSTKSMEVPFSTVLDEKKRQYVSRNRCTGESFDVMPIEIKQVHRVTKPISLRMPNTGTLLNDLNALVVSLAKLSDQEAAGAKIEIQISNQGNYTLDVTDKTREAALKEIEISTKERAAQKREADHRAVQYNQIWAIDDGFQPGMSRSLPRVDLVKENGQWVGNFTDSKSFTVFLKRSAEAASQPGLLEDTKTYTVSPKLTRAGKDKLFATVPITVSQNCFGSQDAANDSAPQFGAEIITQLRAINNGLDTELDQMKIRDAVVREVDPLATYPHYDAATQRTVQYFRDRCSGKTYETTARPIVRKWQVTRELLISSSNLDALSELKDSLNAKPEVLRPDRLEVHAGWIGNAAVEVLEEVEGALARAAYNEFRNGNELQCEMSKSALVCLSRPLRIDHLSNAMESNAKSMSFEAPGGDAPKPIVAVSAIERGKVRIDGVYVYTDIVRKVLQDHLRNK